MEVKRQRQTTRPSLLRPIHAKREKTVTGNPFSDDTHMTRVHPKAAGSSDDLRPAPAVKGRTEHQVLLTVWRKSLLLSCSGFTVFDGKGNLVFRVDNYAADNRAEVVLMDAAGKSLLTIRRKKLRLGDQWMVFTGEATTSPLFSVKKHVSFLHSKSLAHVTVSSGAGRSPGQPAYVIEGSYGQRSCAIYDHRQQKVAEILRKEDVGGATFGSEVFRLLVQPEFEPAMAMSLVILLDQMLGSSSSWRSPYFNYRKR